MKAYAARVDGEVRAETVGPTILSAMVNGLCLDGVVTMQKASDEAIRQRWLLHTVNRDWQIVRVTISNHGPVDVTEGPIA